MLTFTKQRLFFIVLLLMLISSGVAIYYYGFHRSSPSQVTTPAAIFVDVKKITKATIPSSLSAIGILHAKQKVWITSALDGKIESVNFQPGQSVTKGSVLLKLNNDDYKANLASARALIQLYQIKVNRYQKLSSKGFIDKQSFDKVNADLKQQQAIVDNHKALLEKTILRAPFTGTLGESEITVGTYIKAGDNIVQLINRHQLLAIYHLPGEYYPQLKLQQHVAIISDAYPKKTFVGTVNFISPTISQAANTITVHALIDNSKQLLTQGMYVQVQHHLAENKQAILLPASSLVSSLAGEYIYLVVNNKAVLTPVNVISRDHQGVFISNQLPTGSIAIVAGQQKLHDGSIVKINS